MKMSEFLQDRSEQELNETVQTLKKIQAQEESAPGLMYMIAVRSITEIEQELLHRPAREQDAKDLFNIRNANALIDDEISVWYDDYDNPERDKNLEEIVKSVVSNVPQIGKWAKAELKYMEKDSTPIVVIAKEVRIELERIIRLNK